MYPRKSLLKRAMNATALTVCFTVLAAPAPLLAGGPLPTGETVVRGAADIARDGGAMTIHQSTHNLGVDWTSFDIGAENSVSFIQPGADSVAINRIVGPDGSEIMGRLDANGNVFLINPNGVLIGKDAQVSAGGFVASTLNLLDDDFSDGEITLFSDGAAAGILNEGEISAGSVVLAAPDIVNDGVVSTPGGAATLAAGDQVRVGLLGDGLLTAQVERASVNAAIRNRGTISANGGRVSLIASAVQDSLINTEGLIEAKSLVSREGRVFLDGGSGGTVFVEGEIDVSGAEAGAAGGDVTVLGENVGLMAGADIYASGPAGGGEVLIGGNWRGRGPEPNSDAVYMDPNATIRADATQKGDGGTVVLWSDEYTGFYGAISARGGAAGGDGGAVETSSKDNIQAMGSVDAAAPDGAAGEWLLDPADVTIDVASTSGGSFDGGDPNVFTPTANGAIVDANVIQAALNAGTSVTITTECASCTEAGDITWAVPGNFILNPATPATLRLEAHRNIVLGAGVITAGTAGASLEFIAGLGGAGDITGTGTLTTGGGNFLATTPLGDIRLGDIASGGGSTTIRVGPEMGTATGVGDIDVGNVTGSGVSLLNNLAGVGSTVDYTSISLVDFDLEIRQSDATIDLVVGTITQNSSLASTVTFRSARSIRHTANTFTNAGTGAMSVVYNAHYLSDNAGGSVLIQNVNLDTNGGNVTIGGGADPATTAATGISGETTISGRGVYISVSTLDAGGGDFLINGRSYTFGGTATDGGYGVHLERSVLTTSGAGAISIFGQGATGANASAAAGVLIQKGAAQAMDIVAENGAILIDGTGGTAGTGGRNGVLFDVTNSFAHIYSRTGSTTVRGTSLVSGQAAVFANSTGQARIGFDGAGIVTTGAVSILGQTAPGANPDSAGISLGNDIILGGEGSLTLASHGAGLTGIFLAVANIDAGANFTDITIGDANTGHVDIASNTRIAATGAGSIIIAAGGTHSGVAGPGDIEVNVADLTTEGGDITIWNSAAGAFSGVGGLQMDGGTIDARGGNVTITAYGGGSNATKSGMYLAAGITIRTSGTGSVALNGFGGDGANSTRISGIHFNGAGNHTISTEAGDITLTGVGGGGTSSSDRYGAGIDHSETNNSILTIHSISGDITLDGTAQALAASGIRLNGISTSNDTTSYIGWDGGAGIGTTGTVRILGATPAGSTVGANGIMLGTIAGSSVRIKGSGDLVIGNAPGATLTGMNLGRSNAISIIEPGQAFHSIMIGSNSGGTTGSVSIAFDNDDPTNDGNFETFGTGGIRVEATGAISLTRIDLITDGGDIDVISTVNGAIVIQVANKLISNGGGITVANADNTSGHGVHISSTAGMFDARNASGIGGHITISGQGEDDGVFVDAPGWDFLTNGGDIAFTGVSTGTESSDNAIVFVNTVSTFIGWDGATAETANNITFLGATPANSSVGVNGIEFGQASIRGSGALTVGNVDGATLDGIDFPNAGNIFAGSVWTRIDIGSRAGGETGAISSQIMTYQTNGGDINFHASAIDAGAINLSTSALISNGGAVTVINEAGAITTGDIDATGSAGDVTVRAGPATGTANTAGAISVGDVSGGVISIRNLQTGGGSGVTVGAIAAQGASIDVWSSGGNSDVIIDAVSQNFDAANTLTVRSGQSITIDGFANAGAGAATAVLNAHYLSDGAIGAVAVNADIRTKGGDLTIGGGLDPTQTAAVGTPTNSTTSGVFINDGVTLDAAGGHISIRGQGAAGDFGDESNTEGVRLLNALVTTVGAGTVTIDGRGGSAGHTGQSGVRIVNSTITTIDGDITITGTGQSENNNSSNSGTGTIGGRTYVDAAGTRAGIHVHGANVLINTSGIGNIILVGTGLADDTRLGSTNTSQGQGEGIRIGGTGGGTTTTISATGGGSITIEASSDFDEGFFYGNANNILRITTRGGATPGDITITSSGFDNAVDAPEDTQIVSTNDGDIAITGTTISTGGGDGVFFRTDTGVTHLISTTGAGRIDITGRATGSSGDGITSSGEGNLVISTENGAVSMRGAGAGAGRHGVLFGAGEDTIFTITGDISITGTSLNNYAFFSDSTRALNIGVDAAGGVVTTGDIELGIGVGDSGAFHTVSASTIIRNAGAGAISIRGEGVNITGGNSGVSFVSTGVTVVESPNDITIDGAGFGLHGVGFGAGVYTIASINGGNVVISGVSDGTDSDHGVFAALNGVVSILTSGGATPGDITITGVGDIGVYFDTSAVVQSTNNGDITIAGDSNDSGLHGVLFSPQTGATVRIATNGAGAIAITGRSLVGSANGIGANDAGTVEVVTENGDIALRGEANAAGGDGINLNTGFHLIYSTTGHISVTGTALAATHAVETRNVTLIGTDGAGITTSGNITIGAIGGDVGGVLFSGTQNRVETAAGDILIRGDGADGVTGVSVNGSASNTIYTPTGSTTIIGETLGGDDSAVFFNASAASFVGWDGASAGTTGDIEIRGATPFSSTAGAAGINLGNAQLRGTSHLVIGNVVGETLSGVTVNAAANAAASIFTSVTLGTNGASGSTGDVINRASFTTAANGEIRITGTGDITVDGATLNSSGADLTVQSTLDGFVDILNSSNLVSGGGAILISNEDVSGDDGVYFTGAGTVVDASAASGDGGSLTIAGRTSNNTSAWRGIRFANGGSFFSSGAAPIAITGRGFAGVNGFAIQAEAGVTNIGWDGGANVGSGPITILGETNATNANPAAISLTAARFQPNNNRIEILSTGAGLAGGITMGASTFRNGDWDTITIGDAGVGGITANGTQFVTDGGAITFRADATYAGGAGLGSITLDTAALVSSAGGAVSFTATGDVTLSTNVSVLSGGADITVTSTVDGGIDIINSASLVSGGGDITISNSDAVSSADDGVRFTGPNGVVDATGGGNILIIGRTSTTNDGIDLNDRRIFTDTGTVTLIGYANSVSSNAIFDDGANFIGWDGVSVATTGDITILGESAPGETEADILDLNASSLRPNGNHLVIRSTDRGLRSIRLGANTFDANGTWASARVGDGNTADINLGGARIATAGGPIDIDAGGFYDGTPGPGEVTTGAANLLSGGGAVTISNSSLGAISDVAGVQLGIGLTIDAGGGDVTVIGYGGGTGVNRSGVWIDNGTVVRAGAGDIWITGYGGAGGTSSNSGVLIDPDATTVSIHTVSGAVRIEGVAGTGSATLNAGLNFAETNTQTTILEIYSGSGDITLLGRNPNVGGLAIDLDGFNANAVQTAFIGGPQVGAGTTGDIRILGETAAGATVGNQAIIMGLAGGNSTVRIKGSGHLVIGNADPTFNTSAVTLSGIRLLAEVNQDASNFLSVTIGTNGAGTTGGIDQEASFTTAANGDITIMGTASIDVDSAALNSSGGIIRVESTIEGTVTIDDSTLVSRGGAIFVLNNDRTGSNHGVRFIDADTVLNASEAGGAGGDIVIIGRTSTGGFAGVNSNNTGIDIFTNGTGTIEITGFGNATTAQAVDISGVTNIGWDGGATRTAGAITIRGETAPGNTTTDAIALDNARFGPNGQDIFIVSTGRGVYGIDLGPLTFALGGVLGDVFIGDANTTRVDLGGVTAAASGAGVIEVIAGGLYLGAGGGGQIITGAAQLTTAGGAVRLLTGDAAPATANAIGVNVGGAAITSNGGDVTIGGSAAGPAGNLYASGNSDAGISLASGTSIDAGEGDINLYGLSLTGDDHGVEFLGAALTTTTGSIVIEGLVNIGNAEANAIYMNGGTNVVSTVSGPIALNGVVDGVASGVAIVITDGTSGFRVDSGSNAIISETGAVNITGSRTAGTNSGRDIRVDGELYVGTPAIGAPVSASDITFTADSFTSDGSGDFEARSTGALVVQPFTLDRSILIDDNTVDLDTLVIDADWFFGADRVFLDGFSNMTVGRLDGLGAITIDTVTFGDPVTLLAAAAGGSFSAIGANLNAGGTFTVRVGGDATLNAGATITTTGTGDRDIVLSAEQGGVFVNNSGVANPLTTPGRWIVYSTDPTTTVFGTPVLASGQRAFWNSTYDTLPPGAVDAGNRYVFNVAPTATVTTVDTSKIYGDDATAGVATRFVIDFSAVALNGSGTAYLEPVVADAFAPGDFTVISDGSAPTANVGTYAIVFGARPAVSSTGFNLVYVEAGTLTVDPRPITISSLAGQFKQYGDDDPAAAAVAYGVTVGALQNADVLTGAMGREAGETPGLYDYLIGTVSVDDCNGGNNYDITFDGTANRFEITRRALTVRATATKVYGEDDPDLADVEVTFDAVNRVVLDMNGNMTPIDDTVAGALEASVTSLSRTAGVVTEQAGLQPIDSATFSAVTGTSADYYDAPVLGASTIDITAAPLNATLPNQTKVYGTDDPESTGIAVTLIPINRTVTVFGGDTVLIDDTGAVTATATGLKREVGEDVDVYLITDVTLSTPTGAAAMNYSSTATVIGASTLEITRADLTGTVADQLKVYGTDDPALAGVMAILNGVVREVNTWNGRVMIDDSATTALDTTVASLIRDVGENVDTYAITGGTFSALSGISMNNYNAPTFAGGASLRIAEAPLTATIPDQFKVYGEGDPAFAAIAAVLTGVVNRNVLTWNSAAPVAINDLGLTAPVEGLVRDAGETVQSYNIVGASFAAPVGPGGGNYLEPIFVDASTTLTITQRPLTATIPNQMKLYGTDDPSLAGIVPTLNGALNGAVVRNWMNGETTINDAVSAPLEMLVRDPGEIVGFYDITGATLGALNGTGAGNYIAPTTFEGAPTLEIAAVTLTAAIPDQFKVYGTDDPLITGIIPVLTGVVENTIVTDWNEIETPINDLAVTAPLESLTRESGETFGSYLITSATFGGLEGAGARNYTAPTAFAGAPTLTITRAGLTATIANQVKVYGSDDPAFATIIPNLVGVVNGVTVTDWNKDTLTINDSLQTTVTDLARDAGENVATYDITVPVFGDLTGTGSQNYNAPSLGGAPTLEILQADVLTASIPNLAKIYGENDPDTTFTPVTLDGFVDRTVVTWNGSVPVDDRGLVTADVDRLSRVAGETVNFYPIIDATFVLSGLRGGNYVNPALTGAPTLEITRRPLTATIADPRKFYGEDDPPFSTITVMLDALNGVEVVDWDDRRTTINDSAFTNITNLTRTVGEIVGSYPITSAAFDGLTGTGLSNYTAPTGLSGSPALIIDAAQLSASIADQVKVYGADDPSLSGIAPELAGVVSGVTVRDWNGTDTPIDDDLSITLSDLSRDAGETAGTYLITGAAFGDLTGTGLGNYDAPTDLSGAPTLEITPLTLTATIADQTKTYGQDDPDILGIEVQLSGVLNGVVVRDWNDDITPLTDDPTAVLTGLKRDVGEDVASYAITDASFEDLTGPGAGNYELAPGLTGAPELRIVEAPLTGSIVNQAKLYGTDDPSFTGIVVSLDGVVNRTISTWNTLVSVNDSDVATVLTDLTRDPGESAAVYQITGAVFANLTGLRADNYLDPVFDASSTLTIDPVQLTASIADQTKLYGTNDPTLAGIMPTLGGVVNTSVTDWNDVVTPINDALTLPLDMLTREAGENIGDYLVTDVMFGDLAGTGLGNYLEPTALSGTPKLTIDRVQLTATIPNQTKLYGTDDPDLAGVMPVLNGALNNVTVRDWMGGETTINDNPAAPLLNLSRDAGEDVRTYNITRAEFGDLTGTGAGNYRAPTVFAGTPILTITQAPLTATLSNQIKIYGEDDPAEAGVPVQLFGVLNGVTVTDWNKDQTVLEDSLLVEVSSLTREIGEDVGDYDITGAGFGALMGTGAGNYLAPTLTGTPILEITEASLAAIIANQTKIYGDDDPALAGITPTLNGLVNRTVLTWNGETAVNDDNRISVEVSDLTREAGESVRDYLITDAVFSFSGASADNYTAPVLGGAPMLTITQRALTATIANQVKRYGENDPLFSGITPILTGVVNRDAVTWNDTVTINDTNAVSTSVSDLTRASGENVNTYNITDAVFDPLNGAAAGNYMEPVFVGTPTLEITPVQLTATIPSQTKVYGTDDPALAGIIPNVQGRIFGVTVTDWNGDDTPINDDPATTFTGLQRVAGETFGSYPIIGAQFGPVTGTGQQNYLSPTSFTGNPVLTITQAPLTATILNQTKVYGEDDPDLSGIEVLLDGVLEGVTVTDWNMTPTVLTDNVEATLFNLTRDAGEDVLSYAITDAQFNQLTGSGFGNYSHPVFTGTSVLTITRAPLTATIANQMKLYGANDPSLAGVTPNLIGRVNRLITTWNESVSVNDAGRVEAVLTDLVREAGENIGTYDITGAVFDDLTGDAADNYLDPVFTPATLEITPITLTVTIPDQTKTYGQSDSAPGLITPVVTGNLTGVTVTDWMGGETTINDSVATTVERLTRTQGENEGSYLITGVEFGDFQGVGAGNYVAPATFANAPMLTIEKADLTASIPDQIKMYGEDDPAPAGILPTLFGVVRGVMVVDWNGNATPIDDNPIAPLSRLVREAGEDVDDYTITLAEFGPLEGTGARNYNTPTLSGAAQLSITAAPLTALIADQVKVYGEDDPVLSSVALTLSGIVNRTVVTWNDSVEIRDAPDVTAVLDRLAREPGENIGEYDIIGAVFLPLMGLAADNYLDPTLAGAPTLTIARAPLTASIANQTKVYGEDDPTFGAIATTLNGVVDRTIGTWNGPSEVNDGSLVSAVLTDLSRGAGEDVASYPINTGAFSLSGLAADNYLTPTLAAGSTLTITPAPVFISDISKIYDGTVSTASAQVTFNGDINRMVSTWNGDVGVNDVIGITSASGSFATRNVGSSITVTLSQAGLTGVNAGNYVLSGLSGGDFVGPVGSISQRSLVISAVANTKVYDGTTGSASSPVVSGLVGGDTVIGLNQSYADKNAGTGKLLVVDAGFTVDDGNGGLNYVVSLASSSGGVITPATLIVTPAAFSRAEDGSALDNTGYSQSLSNYVISGFVAGETIATAGVSLSGSMAFDGATTTAVRDAGTYVFGQGTLVLTSANGNYVMAFSNPTPNAFVITGGSDNGGGDNGGGDNGGGDNGGGDNGGDNNGGGDNGGDDNGGGDNGGGDNGGGDNGGGDNGGGSSDVNADAEALQQTAIIASAGLATIPAGAGANGVVRWDADRALQGGRAERCLIRVRGDGSRLPEWLRRGDRVVGLALACM